MMEVSSFAAAQYNQILKKQNEFSLCRLITGEVLQAMKPGLDKTQITESLLKLYLDQLLKHPENENSLSKSGPVVTSPYANQSFFRPFLILPAGAAFPIVPYFALPSSLITIMQACLPGIA